MVIDTEQLRTLLAVADTGSFSRAATALHLSQPAVSKRIQELEARLGVVLLDRAGRRVRPTPAGSAVLERARRLLTDLAHLGDDLRADAPLTGALTFAASHHIGLHRLPAPLRLFHTQHPGVRLNLEFLDSESACRAVRRDALEFAVVTLPSNDQGLTLTPLWSDALSVVVERNHPLAGAANPTRADLLRHPALLPVEGSMTRRLIERALGVAHIETALSSNHLEVLKVLAQAGLGWTVLPETLVDGTLKVVHIPTLTMRRVLGVVCRRRRTLGKAARKMIALLQDPLPDVVYDPR